MCKKILLITIALTMVLMSGCGIFGGKNKDPMATPLKEASVELKDDMAGKIMETISEGSDLTGEEKASLKEKILSDIEKGATQEEQVTFANLLDLIQKNKENYLKSILESNEDESENHEEDTNNEESTNNEDDKKDKYNKKDDEINNPSEDAEKIAKLIKEKKITTSEELEKMLEDSNVTSHEKAMLRNYLENIDYYENEEENNDNNDSEDARDSEDDENNDSENKDNENKDDENTEPSEDSNDSNEEAVNPSETKLKLNQHPFLDNVGRILAKIYRGDIKTKDDLKTYGLNDNISFPFVNKISELSTNKAYNEDAVLEGVYIKQNEPRVYSLKVIGNKGLNVTINFNEVDGSVVLQSFGEKYTGNSDTEYVK